tara:strand:- start:356 stop:1291 length:936 start_codon:yes stop_codon:yes gene_type:complete
MTKNTIEIYNPTSKELFKNIEKHNKIFVILDFIKDKNIIKKIKILNDNNFTNPYLTKISPKNVIYKYYVLCLERNNNNNKNDYNLIDNIILILKTYYNIKNKNNCYYNIRFSKCCINSLKNLSYKGFSFESSNLSQNELAGNFYVKILNNNTLELCLNKNSIIEGKSQGVNIKEGLYNFHTHPKKAYEDNKVKIGWPSAQDYIGFLKSYLKYKTILHVVITLEGLYLLTIKNFMSTEFINNNYNEIKEQILKKFKNTRKEKQIKSTDWYIKNINKKRILNKKMFNTIFVNWKNIDNKNIKLFYNYNKICKI